MKKDMAGGWAFFAVLVFALLADGIMEAWGPAGFVAAAGVTAGVVTILISREDGKDEKTTYP